MRLLLGAILALSSSLGFAADAVKVRKTARIIGAHETQEGSVIIAKTPEVAQELAASIHLDAQPQDKLVVFTGKAAVQLRAAMQANSLDVTEAGEGEYKLLVFADEAADEALKVISHVYGEAYAQSGDLVVIKGGLDDLIDCFIKVFQHVLDLGVDLVKLVAKFVSCALDWIWDLAKCLLKHAGEFIIKTLKGIFMLVKFAVDTICEVIDWLGGNAWSVLEKAIECAWHVVDGAWDVVTHILSTIFEWIWPWSTSYRVTI